MDHNASDDTNDDTLTHRIPQTANPDFAKTLIVLAANVEASMRGFEDPSMHDIERPSNFTAVQGAQSEASATNTKTTNLLR
jgi:hypothetical protein